jgi:hypothetical protein
MGWLLLLVGLSVFAVRLQHAVPAGGTLTSALLSLGLGTWFVGQWVGGNRPGRVLNIGA